jgi:uncharacterized protein YbjT (DUF2867 family)
MTEPILLTGGTGTLGRRVLPLLREAGRDVRVLTRGEHRSGHGVEYVSGDLTSGDGVAAAVRGVGTILHCAGSTTGDDDKARNLVKAAKHAGVGHVVLISVVGADRVPVVSRADRAMFGYFASKLGAERVIAGSGIPWTTLRATQFHDLLLTTLQQLTKLPVVPVPSGFRFQPVDTAEVAGRLVELTLAEPAGLVPDLAGPRVYEMDALVRRHLRAAGRRRPIVRVRLPGRAARAFRQGANLSSVRTAGRTWEEFLAQQAAPARRPASSASTPARG